MPFTLAHPAAIWPLRRMPFPRLVPLLAGSITPDLPSFMPARLARIFWATHSHQGSVLQDIPLGMALLVALVVLRVPLTELLGARTRTLFREPIEQFSSAPGAWLTAVPYLFIGIWTHLLWDSFTHDAGWMVRHIAVLRSQVPLLFYTGQLSHVLQYVSSLLGLAVVTFWYRQALAAQPASRGPHSAPSTLVLACVLAAAVVIGVAQAADHLPGQTWYRVFSLLLTRTMAWFGLLYVLAGLAVSLVRQWRMSASPQGQG